MPRDNMTTLQGLRLLILLIRMRAIVWMSCRLCSISFETAASDDKASSNLLLRSFRRSCLLHLLPFLAVPCDCMRCTDPGDLCPKQSLMVEPHGGASQDLGMCQFHVSCVPAVSPPDRNAREAQEASGQLVPQLHLLVSELLPKSTEMQRGVAGQEPSSGYVL